MKSTLFPSLVLALALPLVTVSAFPGFAAAAPSPGPITCTDITTSGREDYFETAENVAIDPAYHEKLVRKSAALFLGIDTSKIPMKRLEVLAEEPATFAVKDPQGNVYAVGQIGFGGGNSVNYYYKLGTLELLPVASYDGDCINQGSAFEFPLEVARVDFDGEALMSCTIADPNSPVSAYTVRVNTLAGKYTGDKADVTATLNPDFENLTKLAKTTNLKKSTTPTQTTVSASRYGTGAGVSFYFNSRKKGERIITLSLFARETIDSKAWGQVYTNKVGGFHASDAYKFEYPATCKVTGEITGKTYQRVLKY